MRDIAEQVTCFERQIINYGAYKLAYLTIMRSIQATQMRGRPSCVVLEAPSGCGKTTLAFQIMAAYAPVSSEVDDTGVCIKRPTLYCGLPPKATIKTFAKSMLKSLGFEAYSGDAFELLERMIQQIKRQKVELAFIDEIQMLSDKKADQAKKDVMDCITRLVDRTGIAFVAQGTPGIGTFFSEEVLAHRFPFSAKLGPLQPDFNNPNSDWQVVLSGLDRKMYEIGHLKRGVHFHELDISLPLYVACGGILEDLRLDLSNAFSFALLRGDETLQFHDLSNTFEITQHPNCLCQDNPFELDKKTLLKKVAGEK